MSNSNTNELVALLNRSVPALSRSVLVPVRGIAFWTAIFLPFLYIPLLLSGLQTTSTQNAFIALLVCNAISLYVGHSYSRS